MEHALTQEIGLGPAVHLALQQLQARDVALGRAVTVGFAQGGGDGGVILAQTLRATPELGDAAALGLGKPGIEGCRVPLADQPTELAGQFAGGVERGAVLQEAGEIRLPVGPSRRSVSPLADIPRIVIKRRPPSPPSAKPSCVSTANRRRVFRA